MLLVAIYANFTIEKTGVYSTAKGILSNYNDEFMIFSNQNIEFLNKRIFNLEDISLYEGKIVSFTHLECTLLKGMRNKFPNSYFHVGDWPINYMNSLINNKKFVKGYFGKIRLLYSLSKLDKSTKLIFVNNDDTRNAINYGFKKAVTLNIGVNTPSIDTSDKVDFNSFCFTGNFRYEPNKLAALELLKLFSDREDNKTLLLAGFNANDFKDYKSNNIKIYDSVPNIIDFLAKKRPIYLSPIKLGAGSKNKILEALVSGCPVYATEESLDETLYNIKLIGSYEVILKNDFELNTLNTTDYDFLSEKIKRERSWASIAKKMIEIID